MHVPSLHTSLPTKDMDRCGVNPLLVLIRNPAPVSLGMTRFCALCNPLMLVDASRM